MERRESSGLGAMGRANNKRAHLKQEPGAKKPTSSAAHNRDQADYVHGQVCPPPLPFMAPPLFAQVPRAPLRAEGCNVPWLKGGCILGQACRSQGGRTGKGRGEWEFAGKAIPAGAKELPTGAVKLACQNADCPAVPWIHAECIAKLEDNIVDEVLKMNRSEGRFFPSPSEGEST